MSDDLDTTTSTDETGEVATPPVPAPATVSLAEVAAAIRQGVESARQSAPAPAPFVPDRTAIERQLTEEGVAMNAQFNELVNSGQADKAMQLRDQFLHKANRALAAPESDNELVKTAVAVGERLARVENKELMTRYGDEVKAYVNALPANERISPGAWDRGVKAVRADHMQELIDEQVGARLAEERKKFTPPPLAPGMRGARRLEGPAAKLTEEQLWGADLCGIEPAEYAKVLAQEAAHDALSFKERGPFPGYPLVSDKVTPGGF